MRYYNGLLNLRGYEICSLRDLLCEKTNSEIVNTIDEIIRQGVEDERIIFDSRTVAQYDFNSRVCIVHGNRHKGVYNG